MKVGDTTVVERRDNHEHRTHGEEPPADDLPLRSEKGHYASGEISSIMLWDLDKEQLVNSIPSSSDFSALIFLAVVIQIFSAASQVHGRQFAAGVVDGSVRLYDVRTPEM
ncbi:hypothetical protein JHK87_050877 [Glycine soja]|nr:hypothetical protein JHK87_050877 [Glycine soja]